MFRIKMLAMAVLTLGLLGSMAAAVSNNEDKPDYTVKEVMKIANKDGLFKTVSKGDGSKADKEMLLKAYVALSKNKPAKGDEKVWKEKTEAIVAAAKAVVADEKGALGKLTKAGGDCKGCHSMFK